MAYLAGICAKHIPDNPGIVINVPTTVTLTPFPAANTPNSPVGNQAPSNPGQTPAPQPGAVNPAAPGAPSTVIPISTVVTLPCPSGASMGSVTQLPDGQPQAGGQVTQTTPESCTTTSVLTTQVTVPQVAFVTSGSGVGLVAGNAPPAGEAAPPSEQPVQTEVGPVGSNTPIAPTSTGVTPFTGAAARSEKNVFLLSFVLAALGLAALA